MKSKGTLSLPGYHSAEWVKAGTGAHSTQGCPWSEVGKTVAKHTCPSFIYLHNSHDVATYFDLDV